MQYSRHCSLLLTIAVNDQNNFACLHVLVLRVNTSGAGALFVGFITREYWSSLLYARVKDRSGQKSALIRELHKIPPTRAAGENLTRRRCCSVEVSMKKKCFMLNFQHYEYLWQWFDHTSASNIRLLSA